MTGNADGVRADLHDQRASSEGQAFMPGRWLQPQRPLLDRSSEQARIDHLLLLVRRGFSGTLVIRGGDGVGKTRLLDYAVGAASGFRISAVTGVESEINLPYSAMHQLIVLFLPLMEDLDICAGRLFGSFESNVSVCEPICPRLLAEVEGNCAGRRTTGVLDRAAQISYVPSRSP